MRSPSWRPAGRLPWGMLAVAAVIAALVAGAAPAWRALEAARAGESTPTFSISGDVTGLYPGALRDFVVTVSNPHTFAIDVQSISGNPVSADMPGCDPDALVIHEYTGSIVIAAGNSATRTLQAELLPDVTDACQGAEFELEYSGTAVLAGAFTVLDPDPVVVRLGPDPRVSIPRLRARLHAEGSGVPGRRVRFTIGGEEACSTVTDPRGYATCVGVVLSAKAALAGGYQVSFAGDTSYQPAAADGSLVVAGPPGANR